MLPPLGNNWELISPHIKVTYPRAFLYLQSLQLVGASNSSLLKRLNFLGHVGEATNGDAAEQDADLLRDRRDLARGQPGVNVIKLFFRRH